MQHKDSPFSMKDLKIILTFIIITLSLGLLAQGVDDAVYYTQTRYEGTARSMAMGGATGAMGGDLTAVCINPAGLGLYRGPEFTFSTGAQHFLITSNYYGQNTSANYGGISIPNLGLVIGGEVSNYKALRYLQLGIGLTRTNDFRYQSTASGFNPKSSMVDSYLQTANNIEDLTVTGYDPNEYFEEHFPFDLNPAWRTFLIDRYVDDEGYYYFNSVVPPGKVWQKDNLVSKGRTEEWTFSAACNLYDKFFLGASFGLSHLKRVCTRKYQETPEDESNSDFTQWEHVEELSDTAWGVNGKVGMIYYPAEWLRIGVSWHSRTRYSFGETWSTETNTELKDNQGEPVFRRYISPSSYQTYNFRTPHTFTGSLAFLFGQQGMLTTDIDYLNYGSSKFVDSNFENANNDIKNILKPSFNIRIGLEWRIRQYYLRSGVAYYGSPYGFGEAYGSMKKLALGLGYTTENGIIAWDFAYELSRGLQGYTPYQYYIDNENIIEDVVQHLWRNKLVITIKMKI